jgi:hypothetical protein
MSIESEMKNIKCNKCKSYKYPNQFFKAGREMKTCSDCRARAKIYADKQKCEHNRQRSNCKDCGGSQICEHNRQRSNCKDCGGSQICEHKRERSKCKDCGGSSICIHNRQRSHCKDCGGASICEHKRERSKCKDCGGASICEHNRRRSQCKDCGGSSICEHNRRRSTCKDCCDELKITIKNMLSCSKRSDKKNNRYDIINFIDRCFLENLIDDCEDKCYYCKSELQYIIYQGNLATIERLDNDLGHIKSNCVIACKTCNVSKVGSK